MEVLLNGMLTAARRHRSQLQEQINSSNGGAIPGVLSAQFDYWDGVCKGIEVSIAVIKQEVFRHE